MNPIILWVSKSADSQARETMLLQAFFKESPYLDSMSFRISCVIYKRRPKLCLDKELSSNGPGTGGRGCGRKLVNCFILANLLTLIGDNSGNTRVWLELTGGNLDKWQTAQRPLVSSP